MKLARQQRDQRRRNHSSACAGVNVYGKLTRSDNKAWRVAASNSGSAWQRKQWRHKIAQRAHSARILQRCAPLIAIAILRAHLATMHSINGRASNARSSIGKPRAIERARIARSARCIIKNCAPQRISYKRGVSINAARIKHGVIVAAAAASSGISVTQINVVAHKAPRHVARVKIQR